MLGKKIKSRIFLLVVLLFSASIVIFFILRSLEENVVYFLSPTEIYNEPNISHDKKIRIGGLVKINSISKSETSINFIADLIMNYQYNYKPQSIHYVKEFRDAHVKRATSSTFAVKVMPIFLEAFSSTYCSQDCCS